MKFPKIDTRTFVTVSLGIASVATVFVPIGPENKEFATQLWVSFGVIMTYLFVKADRDDREGGDGGAE